MKAVLLVVVALTLPILLSGPSSGEIYFNTVPDAAFTLIMQGGSFNGMKYPDTPLLEAAVGDLVQITVLSTTEGHTFHMHGHPWLIPEQGFIDTIVLNSGESHSFPVPAGGVDKQPGDWMYHCHIDSHMAGGMWGIFRVYPYKTTITNPTASGFVVHLDRLGEPVEGATLAATLDGAPLGMHVVPLGKGDYLVHANAIKGVLVVTATSGAWGESVGRAGLGGAEVPTPTLRSALPDGPESSHAHG